MIFFGELPLVPWIDGSDGSGGMINVQFSVLLSHLNQVQGQAQKIEDLLKFVDDVETCKYFIKRSGVECQGNSIIEFNTKTPSKMEKAPRSTLFKHCLHS